MPRENVRHEVTARRRYIEPNRLARTLRAREKKSAAKTRSVCARLCRGTRFDPYMVFTPRTFGHGRICGNRLARLRIPDRKTIWVKDQSRRLRRTENRSHP